jgi:CubicO group peptidase (beta-lactamase class C family)
LLTHTAGIPDHEKPLYRKTRPDGEPTMADALEVLKSQPSPLFSSGSRYQYSDAGYVLLALIIEKVSGVSYREFLTRNIFSPLSMSCSDVLDQSNRPRRDCRAPPAAGFAMTENAVSRRMDLRFLIMIR